MKSKISILLQKICIFLSGAGYLICMNMFPIFSLWRIGFLVALLIASVWHVNNTKCPHCERYGGLKPKPFAPDAGKCIHCGKTVEYR